MKGWLVRSVSVGSALVAMSVMACAPIEDEEDATSASASMALRQGPASFDDEAQWKRHCANTSGCDPARPGGVARRTTAPDATGACAPSSDTLTTHVTCGENGRGTISWTYVRHVLVGTGPVSDGDGGTRKVCLYDDKTWTGSYEFTCSAADVR